MSQRGCLPPCPASPPAQPRQRPPASLAALPVAQLPCKGSVAEGVCRSLPQIVAEIVGTRGSRQRAILFDDCRPLRKPEDAKDKKRAGGVLVTERGSRRGEEEEGSTRTREALGGCEGLLGILRGSRGLKKCG